jgi:RNA polymerase sigma-70 factor (ECF subfamily)
MSVHVERTNDEWCASLRAQGSRRDEVLADLRAAVLRAAMHYVRTRGTGILAPEQLDAIAEEAAQEATLAVLAKLETFRGDSRFIIWASKFGVTMAAQSLRRRRFGDVSLDRFPTDWDNPLAQIATSDGSVSPEIAAERSEISKVLGEVARHDLTIKQRSVLSWVLFYGIAPDEVAERLGISRAACYKLNHDARTAFKRGVEQRGWTCAEILAAFAARGQTSEGVIR